MAGLLEYINASAQRDADGTWCWKDNPASIPVIRHSEAGSFIDSLQDKSEATLLPVQTWERDSDSLAKMIFQMMNPSIIAERLAEEKNIPLVKQILKLNYTNNSSSFTPIKTPSLFISPASGDGQIQQGQKFILLDDNIDSGSTLADLIRHINNRGGVVVGIIDGSDTPHSYGMNDTRLTQSYTQSVYALFWVLDNKIQEIKNSWDAENLWKTVPDGERTPFIAKIQTQADSHLMRIGSTFKQLEGGVRRVQGLSNALAGLLDPSFGDKPYTSMEAFWQAMTHKIECPWPISIEAIKSPEKLAKILGVEWQISAAASTAESTMRVRGVAGNAEIDKSSV